MQDEFEIFRAEAYGYGSVGSGCDPGVETEKQPGKCAQTESVSFLDFDGRSQHQHNYVGVHRIRASNRRSSHIGIDERENRLLKGRRSEVDADVMVEIQPPSPTEIPPNGPLSRQRCEDLEEKRISGAVKSVGLCRRRTAPAARRLSEKRNVIEESRMRTSRTMALTETGTSMDDDGAPEVMMTSKHSIRKKSTIESDAISSSHGSTSRPRDLAVSYQSNQITRRKSTTCTPERLRPTQKSSGKHRRNSYAGVLQSPRSLSPPSRISGRHNSAIIYLSDRVSWNSSSPGSETAAAGHKSYDELRSTGRRSSSTASRLDHVENRVPTGEPVDCHSLVDCSLEHLNNMQPDPEATGSLELINANARLSYDSVAVYRILVVGAPGVGKTTLTHQLLTNEYLANKEEPYQEPPVSDEHSVCIKLDGEESIVRLIDNFDNEEAIEDRRDVDAYLFVYSVTSRSSFAFTEVCLNRLRRLKTRQTVAILVANKQDQVRNRVISSAEGKRLGSRRLCKVFEVSALLDHRVDEVLTAVIRETRLERKRIELNATDSDEVIQQKPCLLVAFSLCGKLFHP